MESPNLTPPSNEDEQLAALFRQHATELPDHGFSRRVLAALPNAEKPSLVLRLLPLIVGAAGGVLGLIFALWHGASFSKTSHALSQAFSPLLESLNNSSLILAVALAIASLLISYLALRFQRSL